MNLNSTPDRYPRIKRRIIVLVCALFAGYLLLAALSLWNSYQDTQTQAERRLASYASALAEHATVTFTTAEWSLDYVCSRLAGKIPERMSEKELYDLLKETVDRFPQLGAIIVFDSDGNILANSLDYPIKKVSIADREYFQYQRNNPSPAGMYFSSPFRSRIDNIWRFMLSKRLSLPDGSFGGIVGVSFNVAYFDDFYKKIAFAESVRIALFRTDAQTLVRSPVVEKALETNVADSPLFSTYLPHTTAGSYVDKGAGYDRSHRLIAFRQLNKYPVVAAISQLHDEMYAQWRSGLTSSLIGGGIFLLLAGTLVFPLFRQLTALETSENVLRERERFLKTLLNAVPAPVFYKDSEGRYLGVNASFETWFGREERELIGKTVFDIAPPEFASVFYEKDQELFRNPGVQVYEAKLNAASGEVRDVVFHKATFFDNHNQLAGLIGVILDITALRAAEAEKEKMYAQLIQAQKMESVGRLAGGVAHDYNNMLAVIFIALELLKLKLPAESPLMEHLGEIERAAIRSRDITHQLLAFSRKQIIQPMPCNLNSAVENIRKSLARLIGEDIDLRFTGQQDLGSVLVDPAQIDQILVNLAVNARDAMPHGGKLTIETRNVAIDEAYCKESLECTPGEYVCLAVSDNGIGMDKETVAHIFEPFFTTKELGKGTGLGLATVYGIVKQNNGFITVYSELGQGASFKLYFPRITAGDAAAKADAREDIVGGNESILLVEDDGILCKATESLLQALGYRVAAVASPAEAIAALQAGDVHVDLLLTDVVMPGMNGAEMRDAIRAMKPDIKVIFMSGYTSDAIVHRGVLDEGIAFVQKPFSAHVIARKIRDVLDEK